MLGGGCSLVGFSLMLVSCHGVASLVSCLVSLLYSNNVVKPPIVHHITTYQP